MQKISLNDIDKSGIFDNGDYQLDPTEKYVINLEEELQFQTAILTSFQIMGAPPALKNYHAWLYKNNFSHEMPNPTNEVVAPYYGVGPLWKTEYSQGIVVKAEDDDDYYIVMECSSKNKGYKCSMHNIHLPSYRIDTVNPFNLIQAYMLYTYTFNHCNLYMQKAYAN